MDVFLDPCTYSNEKRIRQDKPNSYLSRTEKISPTWKVEKLVTICRNIILVILLTY